MTAWAPPLDVEETDKEVLIRAEILGATADDLDVSIHGDALVVSGEKKEEVATRRRKLATSIKSAATAPSAAKSRFPPRSIPTMSKPMTKTVSCTSD